MKRINFWLLILTAAAAFSGYGWLAQRAQRSRLTVQLLEMQQVLEAENIKAAIGVQSTAKGIEASVVKNQNQPREIAVLRTCQALQTRTAALLNTLHILQAQAFVQSGIEATSSHLAPSGAADQLLRPFDAPTPAPALAQRFASYQASLPTMFIDSFRVAAPQLNGQPIIMALATITQTESDLLEMEQKILRHFSRKVGANKLAKNLIAVASAESNVVQLGETYRARLFLVKQLSLPHGFLHMKCNNQPIVVNQQGIGKVRFRVPAQVGPASWHGSIRFNINGRDTTLQVRVPYQVARR